MDVCTSTYMASRDRVLEHRSLNDENDWFAMAAIRIYKKRGKNNSALPPGALDSGIHVRGVSQPC